MKVPMVQVSLVGNEVGNKVGTGMGIILGMKEGNEDGVSEGSDVGFELRTVGTKEGDGKGTRVGAGICVLFDVGV